MKVTMETVKKVAARRKETAKRTSKYAKLVNRHESLVYVMLLVTMSMMYEVMKVHVTTEDERLRRHAAYVAWYNHFIALCKEMKVEPIRVMVMYYHQVVEVSDHLKLTKEDFDEEEMK